MIFQLDTLKDKLKNSPLFKDSFWALFGNIANKGLALLAGILIARFLGVETYGEYGMIRSTLLYIAVFSTFGLGFTVTKFAAQPENWTNLRTIIRAAVTISLLFSGIMALLVIVFAKPLAYYLEAPDIEPTLRLTAVTIVFNSLVTVQTGILAGIKEFKKNAEVNVVSGIVTFVATVILTYYYSLNGAVIALMLSNILNYLLNRYIINRIIRDYPKGNTTVKETIIQQLRFSTPIAVQELAYSVSFWVGNLLLIKLSTYSELGLHAAASQWASAILFIPGVLQNVILSYLSQNTKEKETHDKLLKRLLLINFSTAFVPFLAIVILSPYIVMAYGANYEGLTLVLTISIAATVVRCLVQVYIQEYIAQGRTWELCFIRLGRDVMSVLIAYILIIRIGHSAAALYNLSFMVASVVCLIALYYRHKTVIK